MPAPALVRVPYCGLPCSPLGIDGFGPEGEPRVSGGCRAARVAIARARDAGGPRIAGRPAGHDEALATAAQILAGARRARVGGLAWSTIGTARRAVRIAGRLGGRVAIEGVAPYLAESEAIAIAGIAAATFGAVRRRADVILLWRCDPLAEHPHLAPPASAAGGQACRVMRLGGPGPAGPGDLEALQALRLLTLGRPGRPGRAPSGTRAGSLPLAELEEAAAALREARHPAILWTAEAVAGPTGVAIAVALLSLVRDLGEGRRAMALPLGAPGNVAGSLAALLSEKGHARGLAHDDGADVHLLIGARRSPAMPGRFVVVGPRLPDGLAEPEVFLPAAVPGLEGDGLWMRADGIALPVRGAFPSTAPLEEETLDRLIERLGPPPAAAPPRGTVPA